jgi:hypothetical protein
MAAKKRPSRRDDKPTGAAQPKEAQTEQEGRRLLILFGKNKDGTFTPDGIDLINAARKMSMDDKK